MKTILFATDFSETCDNAFEYLRQFVEGSDIVVSIINVFDLQIASPTAIPTPSYSEWVERKKVRLEEDLASMMQRLPIKNRGAHEAIYGMMPATDISNEVKAYKPDLVVMGLRAKHTLVERMVGTVTSQTIKKIKTPVLAIPFGAKYRGLNHILFPTILSSPSSMHEMEEASLEHLLQLGSMFDRSKIEMVNIRESKASAHAVGVAHKDHPMTGVDYISSEASSIESGIHDCIKERSVDLLVVQKSHSNFWARIFGSSVTRKLMLEVKIPIIVFP